MMATVVVGPPWLGSLFHVSVRSYALSQRRVGVCYGLRVFPAVTSLTVYHRPYVWVHIENYYFDDRELTISQVKGESAHTDTSERKGTSKSENLPET